MSFVIPDSCTDLNLYHIITFKNIFSLTSLIIPTTVKEIPCCSISLCSNLKQIIIPTSVTKICTNAFEYCYELETLVIPPSVVKIENGAINPAVKLLILPQKFDMSIRKQTQMFSRIHNKKDMLDYIERREIFYYENQEFINYLNMILGNLPQLKQQCQTLNQINDEHKSSDKILLQAYKNVSQKYPILFKEFEKEVLRLNPDFKFE